MFSILTENSSLLTTIILAWLPAILVALIHLFKRKDLSSTAKIIWLIIGLIPIIGLLTYGIVNFKNAKKILFLIIAAIAISAIAVWYFIIYSGENNRRNPNDEKAITITPTSIIQEFQTNENAASTKYINKTVELTGDIEKVEADDVATTIFLKTSIESTAVSCRLREKQNVLANTTVTVKGILTGYVLGEIQISEATVTNGATVSAVKPQQPSADTPIAEKNFAKDSVKKKSTNDTIVAIANNKNFKSTKGQIAFYSSTADEDIEATNTQVVSSITTDGNITVAALIKGFRFDNEIMQNHFNEEKYLHSDKYPKSEFKGTIVNFKQLSLDKNATHDVTAKGNLTLRGVTKSITASGTITVENKKLILKSNFKIHVQDYHIDGSDVAEQIEIKLNCNYE